MTWGDLRVKMQCKNKNHGINAGLCSKGSGQRVASSCRQWLRSHGRWEYSRKQVRRSSIWWYNKIYITEWSQMKSFFILGKCKAPRFLFCFTLHGFRRSLQQFSHKKPPHKEIFKEMKSNSMLFWSNQNKTPGQKQVPNSRPFLKGGMCFDEIAKDLKNRKENSRKGSC